MNTEPHPQMTPPEGALPGAAVRGEIRAPHPAVAPVAPVAVDALESLREAVIVTDHAGAISYLNPAASRMLGVTPAEVRGHALRRYLSLLDGRTREPYADPVGRLVEGNPFRPFESEHDRLIRRDHTEIPILSSASLLRDRQGHASGFVLMLRDARLA